MCTLDVVASNGWEILDAAQCPAEVQFSNYCYDGCHRIWMFFVKDIEVNKEGSEGTEMKLVSLCYQCVGTKEKAHCYQIQKLEELIEIYDTYNFKKLLLIARRKRCLQKMNTQEY